MNTFVFHKAQFLLLAHYYQLKNFKSMLTWMRIWVNEQKISIHAQKFAQNPPRFGFKPTSMNTSIAKTHSFGIHLSDRGPMQHPF